MSHGEAWRRNNEEIRLLIAEREAFTNVGKTLQGLFVDGLLEADGFGLTGADLDTFLDDAPFIIYVVLSYDTPIHWVGTYSRRDDHYTIAKPPSKTTAGHRNLCPGYAPVRGEGWSRPRQPDGTRRRIRKEQ